MAYDIGPRIGIEGESEFRNAIRQINTNLKTLGTEMLAVTSQFDKNDKSMEKLTSQNKVLNKQIEEQTQKILGLREGLSAAKEKYGENHKVTQEWQQEVNKAVASLNKMERQLSNNTEEIEKGSDATDEMADNVDEFGKSADEAGKKTITFGDIIKANLISEAIIGGVKALGNAMIDLAKSGIELAKESLANAATIGEIEAAYEQVMGDSADYANNKLKELSDNTGAITSRLKEDFTTQTASWTGLGKTVEDATDLANRSITVAADYAAMYGKTTEESSERIKSFMNGNLGAAESLGISASAAGIASWASKELGIEYDKLEESEKKIIRLNFVETMAANAGITGQAARESGNYANVMENLDKTMSDLKSRLGSSLLPTVIEVAQGFTGMLDGTIPLEEGISKIMDAVGELASNLVTNIPVIAEAGKGILTQLLQGIISNLPQLITTGLSIVDALKSTLMSNIPILMETAKSILEGLIKGLSENLPTIIPTAISVIAGFADTIINNIGKVVDIGINILMSLIQGIISSLPTLIQEVPRIINEFSNAIYAQIPKILKAGVDILIMLVKGIIDSIPTLIANIPQIIMAIVNVITLYNWANLGKSMITNIGNGIKSMTTNIGATAQSLSQSVGNIIVNIFKGGINWGKGLITNIGSGFSSMLSYITSSISSLGTSVLNAIKGVFTGGFDIGKYLIEGLWKGILGAKDWLLGKVGDIAGSILSVFTNKWEIASPSKVTTLYGQYLDEGLAKGIDENASKPISSADALANAIKNALQSVNNFVSATVSAIKKEFQLWQLQNKDLAGSSLELEMQLEAQKEEHKYLIEQIKATESALSEIVSKYGEGSSEALNYKNQLLDLQIEQAKLTNTIDETTKSLNGMVDAQLRASIKNYDSLSESEKSSRRAEHSNQQKNYYNAYEKEIKEISKRQNVDLSVAQEMHKENLLSGIPKYASGTNFHPGGLAWVGELGRELVRLPRGSEVIPNHESERLVKGAGSTYNIYVNNPQPSPSALARQIKKAQQELALGF